MILSALFAALLTADPETDFEKRFVAAFDQATRKATDAEVKAAVEGGPEAVRKFWERSTILGDGRAVLGLFVDEPLPSRAAVIRAVDATYAKYGEDAERDVRMRLSFYELFNEPRVVKWQSGEKDATGRLIDAAGNRVAEHMVRRQCRTPQLAEREVWFWASTGTGTGNLGLRTFIGNTSGLAEVFGPEVEQLPTDVGGDYWRYSRTFIYYATVFDRRDLFAGAEPSELQPKFAEFNRWLASDDGVPTLRASHFKPGYVRTVPGERRLTRRDDPLPEALVVFPMTPFPDWPRRLPPLNPDDRLMY